jgi:uncharacterized protein with PQ loop repeat
MKQKTALKTILVISIAGFLFSGYLSYYEIWGGGCKLSFLQCGSFRLATLPACVYGFIMYMAVFIISLLGLTKKS